MLCWRTVLTVPWCGRVLPRRQYSAAGYRHTASTVRPGTATPPVPVRPGTATPPVPVWPRATTSTVLRCGPGAWGRRARTVELLHLARLDGGHLGALLPHALAQLVPCAHRGRAARFRARAPECARVWSAGAPMCGENSRGLVRRDTRTRPMCHTQNTHVWPFPSHRAGSRITQCHFLSTAPSGDKHRGLAGGAGEERRAQALRGREGRGGTGPRAGSPTCGSSSRPRCARSGRGSRARAPRPASAGREDELRAPFLLPCASGRC